LSSTTTTPVVGVEHAPSVARSRFGAFLELTKPRLSALVVVTAGAGYLLAARGAADWWRFAATLLGTALLAGGASAFNMWLEVGPDGRMARTRGRPLPSGRLRSRSVFLFALLVSALGFVVLLRQCGGLAAGLGLATLLVYVLLYTPLKRVTTLCTTVGAVVGALPPVLGWAAAAGRVEWGGLVLGAILFMWQIPHFLAIAWLYREEYAKSGFKMLPVVDPGGRITVVMTVLYSAALIPVTLAAATIRDTGWLYLLGAVALGAILLAASVRLARERSREAARRLFLVTLAHLPLLLLLLAFDPTG
jgi:protoheme IX farnesyltransferase